MQNRYFKLGFDDELRLRAPALANACRPGSLSVVRQRSAGARFTGNGLPATDNCSPTSKSTCAGSPLRLATETVLKARHTLAQRFNAG
jgi:hypothetical protein